MADAAEELDLDESMAESLREINARESADEEVVEHDTDDTEAEEVTEKAERERDERGRFKAKQKADDAGEEVVDAGADEDVPEPENVTEEKPEYAPPPSTWRPATKAAWNDLPQVVKDEILKREADIGKGISSYKERAETGDRYNQLIQPYMPLIKAKGSTPEQTIQGMLNTVYQLETASPQQKAQLLLEAAQRYGADMSVFGQAPKTDGAPDYSSALTPLQQRIQALEQSIQQRAQQSEQAELSNAAAQVSSFADERDENGHPKHLYFENVREHMAVLISAANEAGRSLSLEEAYDQATWANPEIRSLIIAEQRKKEDAERRAEAARRAAKAKDIDALNVESQGEHAGKVHKPTGSMEDTLRETLKDIHARHD